MQTDFFTRLEGCCAVNAHKCCFSGGLLPLARPLDVSLYKGDAHEIERTLEALSKERKLRDKEIWDITFSDCGNLIAGGIEREIRLWDATTYEIYTVIVPPEESRRPFALAFSPCGRYLVSGTWWWPGFDKVSVRLWDVTTGENIHTFWDTPPMFKTLPFHQMVCFWRAAVLMALFCYGI